MNVKTGASSLVGYNGANAAAVPQSVLGVSVMDSSDLLKLGFAGWIPFSGGALWHIPERAGCYAFRSATVVSLKRGSSDIQYLGRAMSDNPGPRHNLRHCLREYLHPGHDNKTRLRVRARAVKGNWQISWLQTAASDQVECDLLRRFFAAHRQLPPENRTWPKNCG